MNGDNAVMKKPEWPWDEQYPSIMPGGESWPRISIVTPSYNQGHYLEETITSVLLQGYPNLEYVVIDGGSSDNSIEIIRKYGRSLTYWVSEKDRGQSHAINKGFRQTSGEIICWLNSDDYLEPGALKYVGQYFRKHPETHWLVGRCRNISTDGRPAGIFNTNYRGIEHLLRFWQGAMLPQPSSFWRRGVVEDCLLREDLHYAMDYELWLRLAGVCAPVIVPDVLANYRMHPAAKTVEHADSFLPDLLAAARPYWRRRGTRFRLGCEIGWRRHYAEGLYRQAFRSKHEGDSAQAHSLLSEAVAAYPPYVFNWRVINLAFRLCFRR